MADFGEHSRRPWSPLATHSPGPVVVSSSGISRQARLTRSYDLLVMFSRFFFLALLAFPRFFQRFFNFPKNMKFILYGQRTACGSLHLSRLSTSICPIITNERPDNISSLCASRFILFARHPNQISRPIFVQRLRTLYQCSAKSNLTCS